MNYFTRRNFEILVLLFFLFLVLSFSSFPWSGSLDDVQATFPWKGGSLPQLGVPSGTPPCGGVSRSGGALSLLAVCLRKSGPPQDGVLENHQGSGEFSPVRLAASTVRGSRQSSFPFSGRTFTGSPSEYKRFPPLGDNPETHGAPAGQDSVPQGGSQGRVRSTSRSRESHPRLSTWISKSMWVVRIMTSEKATAHTLGMREEKIKEAKERFEPRPPDPQAVVQTTCPRTHRYLTSFKTFP